MTEPTPVDRTLVVDLWGLDEDDVARCGYKGGDKVALLEWRQRMDGYFEGRTPDGWFIISEIRTQEGRIFKTD